MATARARVVIKGHKRSIEEVALADTSTAVTLLHRRPAEELGVKPTGRRVKLHNPHDRSKPLEPGLPADTDSMYTWVRRERLEKLGIRPMARWRFRALDGRMMERDVGEAVAECMGERATTIVIFAEKGDREVLGMNTLEGLRLEVDPVTKQLRKVEAVLAF